MQLDIIAEVDRIGVKEDCSRTISCVWEEHIVNPFSKHCFVAPVALIVCKNQIIMLVTRLKIASVLPFLMTNRGNLLPFAAIHATAVVELLPVRVMRVLTIAGHSHD